MITKIVKYQPSGLIPTNPSGAAASGYQEYILSYSKPAWITIGNQMITLGSRMFVDSESNNPIPIAPFQSVKVDPKSKLIFQFRQPIVVGAGGISSYTQSDYAIIFSDEPLQTSSNASGNGANPFILVGSLVFSTFYNFVVDGIASGDDSFYLQPQIGCNGVSISAANSSNPSWKCLTIDKVGQGFNRVASLVAERDGTHDIPDSIVLPSSSTYYIDTFSASGASDCTINISPSHTVFGDQYCKFWHQEIVTGGSNKSTDLYLPKFTKWNASHLANKTVGGNSAIYELHATPIALAGTTLATIATGGFTGNSGIGAVRPLFQKLRQYMVANATLDTTFVAKINGLISIF